MKKTNVEKLIFGEHGVGKNTCLDIVISRYYYTVILQYKFLITGQTHIGYVLKRKPMAKDNYYYAYNCCQTRFCYDITFPETISFQLIALSASQFSPALIYLSTCLFL